LDLLQALLAGLFGLLIGSFLNVCIYRMPRDLSVVAPRSFCPGCESPIAWYDNIPVLSFLLLRGRCRKCAARISWRYPVVELLTGFAFFIAVYLRGLSGAAIQFAVFAAIIIELVFSDLEERILPDEFTLGGAALGIILAAIWPSGVGLLQFFLWSAHQPRLLSAADALLAALFCSGVLWGIGALYQKVRRREGLGLGDVKMFATIGAFLGLPNALMGFFAGSVLGSVVGLSYILITRKDASSYPLPFGTFLGIGAVGVAAWMNLLPHPVAP
jgi:leader peptidase (prepilin peptidase)/N-methyltransferase